MGAFSGRVLTLYPITVIRFSDTGRSCKDGVMTEMN